MQAKTNSDLSPVRPELQQIVNGGFPATITADACAANNALSPSNIDQQLHQLFNTALPDGDVVSPDYEAVIGVIITLQAQVALGDTD